jgi:type I restriction enzyme, S subunit
MSAVVDSEISALTSRSVPQGYKKTEVGVIPEDWEIKAFGDFACFRNGLNFIKSDQGDTVKVVGVADFKSHFRISYDQLDTVQIAGSLNRDDLLQSDDLLFVRSNGNKALIGRCIILEGLSEVVSFSGFTIRARVLGDTALPVYVGSFFQSRNARRQINDAGEGSNISNLSQQVLASLKLPLPNLTEQRAIATALSDVDALLGALERLIAKKRDLKQAAMQQLLTGQTRLPGFHGEWEEKSVGSVCKLINGRGFKPHEWRTTGLPIIRIQNLNGSDDFNYFDGPYAKKLEVENGQLLFAWSGSRGTSFGPHIWRGSLGLLNYHTWKVLVDDRAISKEFFLHALKKLTTFIEDRAHGASALVHTQKWEMEGFTLPVPPTTLEQTAIAEVLSDIDADIAALEQRLDKTRALKQGMMQELLTGKTRLVAPSGTTG